MDAPRTRLQDDFIGDDSGGIPGASARLLWTRRELDSRTISSGMIPGASARLLWTRRELDSRTISSGMIPGASARLLWTRRELDSRTISSGMIPGAAGSQQECRLPPVQFLVHAEVRPQLQADHLPLIFPWPFQKVDPYVGPRPADILRHRINQVGSRKFNSDEDLRDRS